MTMYDKAINAIPLSFGTAETYKKRRVFFLFFYRSDVAGTYRCTPRLFEGGQCMKFSATFFFHLVSFDVRTMQN